MDQKAHLTDRASAIAGAFSEALQSVSPLWNEKTRISRQLFGHDPFERLVPEKLLFEGAATLLRQKSPPRSPVVLFMNRGGHGDGAKVAGGLMPVLASQWREISFVHVSFNTPARGLGALVRSVLLKHGAENGIDVQVVCHNRPPHGLRLSEAEVAKLTDGADFIISFASAGAVAPFTEIDPLVERSHLAILSFPDPEGLVGELERLEARLGSEPNLSAIRFWVEVENPDAEGGYDRLGDTTLGSGGDAKKGLWKLIEEARRHRYRVLVEPWSDDIASGDAIVCPCRTLLETHVGRSARIQKIVPAGARFIVSALGRSTLS